jgi:hypothetical protein
MFKKILVALDNSPTDQAMVAPICELARLHGSELVLLHVADGWRREIITGSSSPNRKR